MLRLVTLLLLLPVSMLGNDKYFIKGSKGYSYRHIFEKPWKKGEFLALGYGPIADIRKDTVIFDWRFYGCTTPRKFMEHKDKYYFLCEHDSLALIEIDTNLNIINNYHCTHYITNGYILDETLFIETSHDKYYFEGDSILLKAEQRTQFVHQDSTETILSFMSDKWLIVANNDTTIFMIDRLFAASENWLYGDNRFINRKTGKEIVLSKRPEIYSMYESGNFIWATTSDGLVRFNDKSEKWFFKGYEFNKLSYYYSDSLFILGGIDGLVKFDPLELTKVNYTLFYSAFLLVFSVSLFLWFYWNREEEKEEIPARLIPISNIINKGITKPKLIKEELEKEGIYISIQSVRNYKSEFQRKYKEKM